jgi:hypothetical protein
MCAATCSAFSASNGGVVDIEIGCASVILQAGAPRREERQTTMGNGVLLKN